MSVLLHETIDGVAILTLNDPGRRNLLSPALCMDLIAAVDRAEADPMARAIVIEGAGPAFCAGADLKDLQAAAAGQTEAVECVYRSFMRVAGSTLPTLALVAGPAVGAGLNLALACDMRFCAPEASFDTRFLAIGLHPGGGHGWMLLRAVGWQQAARMLLCGERIGGEQAAAMGLALACRPAAELRAHALKLCKRLGQSPKELLTRTKTSLRHAAEQTHAEAFAHETAEQMWSLHQHAFRDLVQSLETRIASPKS